MALLVVMLRRTTGGWATIAALVTATGFCVPFLGEYDLVIFFVAGLWVAVEGLRNGWLPYERMALAVLYASPG